mgnify:CR=1 FL=1
MGGNGWQIVEADSFERGVASCGGHQSVEEAIAPIKLGVSSNQTKFLSTDFPDIYLAKTKLRWNGPEIVMAHSVWFRVIDASRTVELLWVEWTNPENGGWSDGDEIHF